MFTVFSDFMLAIVGFLYTGEPKLGRLLSTYLPGGALVVYEPGPGTLLLRLVSNWSAVRGLPYTLVFRPNEMEGPCFFLKNAFVE